MKIIETVPELTQEEYEERHQDFLKTVYKILQNHKEGNVENTKKHIANSIIN